MITLLLSCGPRTAPVDATEPMPTAYHSTAEAAAQARVPDPARGGPPVHSGASPLPPFLGVDRSTARYVGVAACAACHNAEANAWSDTRHAFSIVTLDGVGRGHDPRCLPCHVTGLGHPGGDRPGLAMVGCESCHGPGSEHVASPAPGYGALPSDGSACVGCHTHDNSPDFRWQTYWPAISHPR